MLNVIPKFVKDAYGGEKTVYVLPDGRGTLSAAERESELAGALSGESSGNVELEFDHLLSSHQSGKFTHIRRYEDGQIELVGNEVLDNTPLSHDDALKVVETAKKMGSWRQTGYSEEHLSFDNGLSARIKIDGSFVIEDEADLFGDFTEIGPFDFAALAEKLESWLS